MIRTRICLAENEVSFRGKEAVRREVRGERRRGKVPLVAFARELRMQNKCTHTLYSIALVYAKIDHRYVGLAANDRQNTYEQGYRPCAQTISFCPRASSNAIVRWRHSS